MSDEYSLWIVPDRQSAAYQRFESLIQDFATTQADAPTFEPHVTVLGGISGDLESIQQTAGTLADEQGPLEITFTSVQCSTTRYQCVFVLVEPTLELLSLHQTAVEHFDVPAGMYVPHLSLIYSDMSLKDRIELVESVETEFLPTTAQAETLAVVETASEVPEWTTVATYQL